MGIQRPLAVEPGWVKSVQVMVEEVVLESVISVFFCISSLL